MCDHSAVRGMGTSEGGGAAMAREGLIRIRGGGMLGLLFTLLFIAVLAYLAFKYVGQQPGMTKQEKEVIKQIQTPAAGGPSELQLRIEKQMQPNTAASDPAP
jgi:hypothetical protein